MVPEKEQYILGYETRDDFMEHQAPVTQQLRSGIHTKSVWGLRQKQAKEKQCDTTICSPCVHL